MILIFEIYSYQTHSIVNKFMAEDFFFHLFLLVGG